MSWATSLGSGWARVSTLAGRVGDRMTDPTRLATDIFNTFYPGLRVGSSPVKIIKRTRSSLHTAWSAQTSQPAKRVSQAKSFHTCPLSQWNYYDVLARRKTKTLSLAGFPLRGRPPLLSRSSLGGRSNSTCWHVRHLPPLDFMFVSVTRLRDCRIHPSFRATLGT